MNAIRSLDESAKNRAKNSLKGEHIDVLADLEETVQSVGAAAKGVLGLSPQERDDDVMPARKFNVPFVVGMGGAMLTLCAGIINVVSFLHCASFVSHATGTLSKIGMGLHAQDGSVFGLVGLLACFVAGSMTCGLFIGKNKIHFGMALYDFGLLSISCLTIATYATADHSAAKYFAAAACGLQNGLCTEWGGASIRTTHVTGLLTDVGLLIGRIISIIARKGCGKKLDVIDRALFADDRAKLTVLTCLGFSFFLGAFLGALLYSALQSSAFLIPAGVTGSFGTLYLFYRVAILRYRLFSDLEMECVDLVCDVVHQEADKGPETAPTKRWSRRLSRQISLHNIPDVSGIDVAARRMSRSASASNLHEKHEQCLVSISRKDILKEIARRSSSFDDITDSGNVRPSSDTPDAGNMRPSSTMGSTVSGPREERGSDHSDADSTFAI